MAKNRLWGSKVKATLDGLLAQPLLSCVELSRNSSNFCDHNQHLANAKFTNNTNLCFLMCELGQGMNLS